MPTGCDTFVALPPYTEYGFVVFGKNSDRPSEEVQEIVYVPSATHQKGSKLLCTYIEIDQVERTNAVVLSKPAWMWGAEMGANELGVVVGNEAVWTKLRAEEVAKERLLGMDLLRLGLERSGTAYDCVRTIGELLEKYGQGGCCSEDVQMTYHNSFLIADRQEAWIMETADCVWVAAKVDGYANISNNLTIGKNYTLKSNNLEKVASQSGLWKEGQPLSFKEVFSAKSPTEEMRQINGRRLMEAECQDKRFSAMRMMSILRDEESGICMGFDGAFSTTGSQVSILPTDKNLQCVHFFTGTPNPRFSGYKPFVFVPGMTTASPLTVSPVYPASEDPAKCKPRFQKKVDRRHALYKSQQSILKDKSKLERVMAVLRVVESSAIEEIEGFLGKGRPIVDGKNLFKEAVETEMQMHKHS
uniref:Secernin-2 n=1 Tax=Trichuris muris TaxID=70415 RepID=A0A5S6QNX9_TRIMR